MLKWSILSLVKEKQSDQEFWPAVEGTPSSSTMEKHGEPLYEMINNVVGDDRKVHSFVHGSVDVDLQGMKTARLQRKKTAMQ